MSIIITKLVLCLAFLKLATAIVPSLGLSTAEGERSPLADSDFHIRFTDGTLVTTPAFNTSAINLGNHPALAGADVQATIFQLDMPVGGAFPLHYNPRARSVVYVVSGTVEAMFRFEGSPDARQVTNIVTAGEAAIIPEALLNQLTCISDVPCRSVSILNSADPGAIFV